MASNMSLPCALEGDVASFCKAGSSACGSFGGFPKACAVLAMGSFRRPAHCLRRGSPTAVVPSSHSRHDIVIAGTRWKKKPKSKLKQRKDNHGKAYVPQRRISLGNTAGRKNFFRTVGRYDEKSKWREENKENMESFILELLGDQL